MNNKYDVIVIGSGAAGMIASIEAKKNKNKVLLIEQQDKLGPKLKATGGGRCNLTNTLDNDSFMNSFGRNGKFMIDALKEFDHKALMDFFKTIGVDTHIPDGFRVFPVTHNSSTIINALKDEIINIGIDVKTNTKVLDIFLESEEIAGVKVQDENIFASNVIVATGGLGFSKLGSNGDGYKFATSLGHKVTKLYAAMLPLISKEKWGGFCKADTIAKAILKVDIPKYKNLKATGDLIFTSQGIRGPVVLDFSREITFLLDKYEEVPILMNLVKGMNEEEIFEHFKKQNRENPQNSILKSLNSLLPCSVIEQLCKQIDVDFNNRFKDIEGIKREQLVKIVVNTPLTIVDHVGFEKAMITRGGVSLKQINPKTMQSKLVKGLYFCGEVMDLDGPCGGYNLQWAFSSGYMAGKLKN